MVIIDTTVWTLILRRNHPIKSPFDQAAAEAFIDLSRNGHIGLLGLVRQELLSGIGEFEKYTAIKAAVAHFDDVPVATTDYELAAQFHNTCRNKGIQGSHIDFLICAVAHRLGTPILSTDKDFFSYAKLLPIRLHPAMQPFQPL
jgi:predicted nucleic acid-binding protein